MTQKAVSIQTVPGDLFSKCGNSERLLERAFKGREGGQLSWRPEIHPTSSEPARRSNRSSVCLKTSEILHKLRKPLPVLSSARLLPFSSVWPFLSHVRLHSCVRSISNGLYSAQPRLQTYIRNISCLGEKEKKNNLLPWTYLPSALPHFPSLLPIQPFICSSPSKMLFVYHR